VPNLPGVAASTGTNRASADAYVGELLCRPSRGGSSGKGNGKDKKTAATVDEQKGAATNVEEQKAAAINVEEHKRAASNVEEQISSVATRATVGDAKSAGATTAAATSNRAHSTQSNVDSAGGTETTSAAGTSRRKVVIIAKHLCGVATDMALRSLSAFLNYEGDSSTSASAQTAESLEQKEKGILDDAVRGVSIATCCHHACAWQVSVYKLTLDISRSTVDLLA
jgi:hypothetical protein